MDYRHAIRKHATGLLVGYALQFLAGMSLNLFATIPNQHPGANGAEYFSSSGRGLIWALSGNGGIALAIHAYIALALVAGSVSLVVTGIRHHDRLWSWCGGTAAFFTIGAFFNGLSFIDYNHDFSSMIMATCWLLAVGALIYAMGITVRGTAPARRDVTGPGVRTARR